MYPGTNLIAKLLFFFQLSVCLQKKISKMLYLDKKFVNLQSNCYLHISI